MDDRTKDHVFFHRIKTKKRRKDIIPWEDSKEFEFQLKIRKTIDEVRKR
jgi:hypothetical protein